MIDWTPHAALRMFRESETVNIYFDTKTDGIIFKDLNPIGLKNRGIASDAISMKTFPKMMQIHHDGYMMELKDSLVKIIPVLSGVSPSLVIFAMTFKGLSRSATPRFIFSNETGTRSISVRETTHTDAILKIYSAGIEKEIVFDYTEWSGLFIQYKCEEGIVSCKYLLNDEHGTLSDGTEDKIPSDTLYIGGHPNKELANHAMGSFEMYTLDQAEYLPDKMAKLLVNNILKRVDSEN